MSNASTLNARRLDQNGFRHLLFACTLLVVFAAIPLHAQMFQDLYDFNCSTGGCLPSDNGSLTQGKDGNLYGTTFEGGSAGVGTIFMVTPTTPAVYTDLWEFDGVTAGYPSAALTLASDGNFYGTTFGGGTYNLGTVFRFTPPSTLTVLYSFPSANGRAAPVEAKDGNLYGVNSSGLAYRVTLPSGTVTRLPQLVSGYSFSPLLLASNGDLYGTTWTDPEDSQGTVFSMTTTGVIKVVHTFTGPDGANPIGPLVQASNGNLYGTTSAGGAFNDGVIFEMSLAGKTKVLHNFDLTDGAFPHAGLLAESDGILFGVTPEGGVYGFGTLFQITEGGSFAKLLDFTGATGAAPGNEADTTLMAHTNGTFYGITSTGGASSDGNIYSFTPPNPLPTLIVEGPIFLRPGVSVVLLGNNLEQITQVSFAGVPAQFQPSANTFLTATVPTLAVDGFVTATFPSGGQIQTQSAVHILPMIHNLDPSSGPVGAQVAIVGGGFAGATRVTFGGVKSTSFKIISPGLIEAIVPLGAKTGKVTVTTHNGTATSKETFTVN